MKNHRKFLAGILSLTMMVSNTAVIFAEEISEIEANSVSEVGNPADNDVFEVVLPTSVSDTTFDFILDPQGLIEASGQAKPEYKDKVFEKNTNLFFKNDKAATGGIYDYSSTSDKVTVINKGSFAVDIEVKASVQDLGGIAMKEQNDFTDDNTASMYLALTDGETTEPITEQNGAVLRGSIAAGKDSSHVIEDEEEQSHKDELDNTADDAVFPTYEFNLVGNCNNNAEADWSGVTGITPRIDVTWTIEGKEEDKSEGGNAEETEGTKEAGNAEETEETKEAGNAEGSELISLDFSGFGEWEKQTAQPARFLYTQDALETLFAVPGKKTLDIRFNDEYHFSFDVDILEADAETGNAQNLESFKTALMSKLEEEHLKGGGKYSLLEDPDKAGSVCVEEVLTDEDCVTGFYALTGAAVELLDEEGVHLGAFEAAADKGIPSYWGFLSDSGKTITLENGVEITYTALQTGEENHFANDEDLQKVLAANGYEIVSGCLETKDVVIRKTE